MKALYIVRHAKSSWSDPTLADFDRPLNTRGKKDAPRMGKRLKEKRIVLDLIISSPAKRALSTAKIIAEVLDFPKDNLKTEKALYHASEEEILAVVKRIKDKYDSVMIVSHNPGLMDFINRIMKLTLYNVPTCGVAGCAFDVSSWNDVTWGRGSMLFYDFPKNTQD